MTEGVVDQFEMVEIKGENAHRLTNEGVLPRLCQPILKQNSVRQSRERVMQRTVSHPCHEPPSLPNCKELAGKNGDHQQQGDGQRWA